MGQIFNQIFKQNQIWDKQNRLLFYTNSSKLQFFSSAVEIKVRQLYAASGWYLRIYIFTTKVWIFRDHWLQTWKKTNKSLHYLFAKVALFLLLFRKSDWLVTGCKRRQLILTGMDNQGKRKRPTRNSNLTLQITQANWILNLIQR